MQRIGAQLFDSWNWKRLHLFTATSAKLAIANMQLDERLRFALAFTP